MVREDGTLWALIKVKDYTQKKYTEKSSRVSEPRGPRLQSRFSRTLDFASRVVSNRYVVEWASVVF